MPTITNVNGLHRLGYYDNVTRPYSHCNVAERNRSVTFRSRPREYEGLPQPSQQYSNYEPEFESKRQKYVDFPQYAAYVPPHAMYDRKNSISFRNREYQDNKRAQEYQRIEDYVRSYKGLRNLIGLVKCDYQVPVVITPRDTVVSTKHPRCYDGYYATSKQQIYSRVYYHM